MGCRGRVCRGWACRGWAVARVTVRLACLACRSLRVSLRVWAYSLFTILSSCRTPRFGQAANTAVWRRAGHLPLLLYSGQRDRLLVLRCDGRSGQPARRGRAAPSARRRPTADARSGTGARRAVPRSTQASTRTHSTVDSRPTSPSSDGRSRFRIRLCIQHCPDCARLLCGPEQNTEHPARLTFSDRRPAAPRGRRGRGRRRRMQSRASPDAPLRGLGPRPPIG